MAKTIHKSFSLRIASTIEQKDWSATTYCHLLS
jgi:hypothetical protein